MSSNSFKYETVLKRQLSKQFDMRPMET